MSATIAKIQETANITEPTLSWLTLDQWQAFAALHPDGNAFHHESWLRLLMDQYGFGLRIPALKRNGDVVAAVPFLETASPRGKRKLISLPFTDCARVLAVDSSAEESLCRVLASESWGNYGSLSIRTPLLAQGRTHVHGVVAVMAGPQGICRLFLARPSAFSS